MSTIDTGRESFRLTNEICPIILTNGVAADMPGGLLPIISITQGADFDSLLAAATFGNDLDLDNFFAHFTPMPGATLAENQLGQYPFANQLVAANAIIAQPLRISLLMICPARQPGDYPFKLSTFQAITGTLKQHTQQGGTYTVVTPAYVYYNCILTNLRDVSQGQSRQVQDAWQWDFVQPLLTQADALEAQSSLMSKLTAQVPLLGDPPSFSGLASAVGIPGSGVGASLIPAGQSLGGSLIGQFGAAIQSGGAAIIQRVSDFAVNSVANAIGSSALDSFVSSSTTRALAQVASKVAGTNVAGAVSVLAGHAVSAAQGAVMAAGTDAGVTAAQRALNLAQSVLSGSTAAYNAAGTDDGKDAVNTLISSATSSVTAAAVALQEAAI